MRTKVKLLVGFWFIFIHGVLVNAQGSYQLKYIPAEGSDSLLKTIEFEKNFNNKPDCEKYINNLPLRLQSMGFITASVDSVWMDSTYAVTKIFVGKKYLWESFKIAPSLQPVIAAMHLPNRLNNQTVNLEALQKIQQSVFNYLENNGYPFAKLFLDSVSIADGDKISAVLNVVKNAQATFDSVFTANRLVSNNFLRHFLELNNNSPFNKLKLAQTAEKLKTLSFLQEVYPAKLSWNGVHSKLELFLKKQPINQVNVLIGFLPNTQPSAKQNFLITGDVFLNLTNEFSSGENILVSWQQLQRASPRLKAAVDFPYVFKSPVGFFSSFELYKKDSAYTNISFNIGTKFIINEKSSGKLFLQNNQTNINAINESQVLFSRKLPPDADVSNNNLGLQYETFQTNSRKNPTRGFEFMCNAMFGLKKISKSNAVLSLKDPANPAYNFDRLYDTVKLKSANLRTLIAASKYLPLAGGKRNTIKLGLAAGWYQSDNYFRNEMFQIGGFKLLRGFDEESQFLSSYAIGTVEYRYLVAEASYFYGFTDVGTGANRQINTKPYQYFSTGIGMVFQTPGIGTFNLAWAIGGRNDTGINLQQSKIHFGYLSYF